MPKPIAVYRETQNEITTELDREMTFGGDQRSAIDFKRAQKGNATMMMMMTMIRFAFQVCYTRGDQLINDHYDNPHTP